MNKIYVAAHKPFSAPEDALYVPIQVNAQKNPAFTAVTDHTGDNISAKNDLYGELTALYWIWKNETEASHVGLCHYRRYFLNEKHQLLTSRDCDKIFENYDIILPYQTICPGMNYREMFAASHNLNDLKAIEAVIARIKPEYLADYQKAICSETYYMGNLFITSRELFCQYASWLFDIFTEAEKVIDASGYDRYHHRVYGFLSEQMLMAWVRHQGLRVFELEVSVTSEKAETTELLAMLADFLAKGQVDDAANYYLTYIKQRPDVRFPESDTKGLLPYLELSLDILKSERNLNLTGICTYGGDLMRMITFVKEACIHTILAVKDGDRNAATWLMEHHVTWVMAERILEKEKTNQKTLIANINRLAMLFHSIACDLECLKLIRYALNLDPQNSAGMRHASVVCSMVENNRYPMNIAIATNRRYVHVSMVCLYSLFFNNPDADIRVFVLNCELTEDDAKMFQELARAWNQSITLVGVNDMELFEGLPTTEAWSREAYFRLLMPDLLPSDIERILYLDVDTIVNQPIREFYETEFNGMDFVVCEDIMLNRAYKGYYQEHFEELRDREFTYFNSGVMLWNLEQIRRNYNFSMYRDKLFKYLAVLQCMDQDILNIVHCGKTVIAEWTQYNLLVPTAIQNHFSYADVMEFSSIIHFLGPKPWNPDVEFQELYQIWKDYESLLDEDDFS